MPVFGRLGCCGKGSVRADDPRHPNIVAAELEAAEAAKAPAQPDEGESQLRQGRPVEQWLPRATTKAFQSAINAKRVESVLEMTGDHLCVRTMTVAYTSRNGNRRVVSQSGYRVKLFLPEGCTDIEVTFSVVGGSFVAKEDASGGLVPEKFEYKTPPEYVQYFVRGSLMRSRVTGVDERTSGESLLEMVSRDFRSIRTMRVDYLDASGQPQTFTGSGYRVVCHLPADARDVEVSFQVVGGGPICKVDRRDPDMPFLKDANGDRPPEIFCYPECPSCVQFEVRGLPWRAHVSRVIELTRGAREEDASPATTSGPDGRGLFDGAPDTVPAVGGIVELREAHSEYLLPPEVLLFEPTAFEIFARGEQKKGGRQIFLNQPLTEEENAGILEFRKTLVKRGVVASETDPLPRYIESHVLRLIQSAKYNMQKAADMMKTCVTERVRRLPIAEADVLNDLRLGFAYWHGRDKRCRPCLVLRLERLGPLLLDKERAVRVVIFVLEYALRFAMVPGRVENWVVIIDLQNVMSIVNPLHIGSLISTASAIGTTLEKVYCGRMVWIKIVNMPGSSMLTRAINSVIPAEKKDKVDFPMDVKAALKDLFQPNQLERKYGGASPDLEPAETYPFKFFPNPRGRAYRENAAAWHNDAGAATDVALDPAKPDDGQNEVEDFSMHLSASLHFHEGLLWDESCEDARRRWMDGALNSTLTADAAAAIATRHGKQPRICRSLTDWMQSVNPQAVGQISLLRAVTESLEERQAQRSAEPEILWAANTWDVKIISL
mmetsp:Transcript_108074/g.312297  ORF Transcript_108074/g.312297 Transcript_108074/m.312297 type:complete len:775 (+) Transcript_108074:80-2404(+)